MQGDLGTPAAPLRVAIIGSGPSGFYAAEHLQGQEGLEVQIDMYDRLPTPWGLVRGGVAPDHQKIESVTHLLTDPALKGKVTLLTEMRDTLGLVLLELGKDPANFTDADFDSKTPAYKFGGQ